MLVTEIDPFLIHSDPFFQHVPFVVIKQQENITELLLVMDAKVSFDDQFVGNTHIHVDSVEHVKLIKVKILILLSDGHK